MRNRALVLLMTCMSAAACGTSEPAGSPSARRAAEPPPVAARYELTAADSPLLWMVGEWDCDVLYTATPVLVGVTTHRTTARYDVGAAYEPGTGIVVRSGYEENGDEVHDYASAWTLGEPDDAGVATARLSALGVDGWVVDGQDGQVAGPLSGGVFDGELTLSFGEPRSVTNTIRLRDGRVFALSYVSFAHSKPDTFGANWRIGSTSAQQQYLQQLCSRRAG